MAHPRPIDKEFEDADDTGVLVISGRNLRQFPNVPGDLLDYGDVFEADFSKNRFDRVPREVLAFKAVVKLDFYHNSLRYIPEELSILTNLRELNFSRNYLQAIPPELCQMDLHSLNLSNNRLVSLPVELGKLQNLLFLDLSCNTLQELPTSFCQLFSLQHLNLHRNELRDLPTDIDKLENLKHLDISANCLSQLPTSLRQLETLQTFHTHSNPLESPPTQVCMRGLVHIYKYLSELEKRGSDPYLLQSQQRDESLRRRKEKLNKRNSGKPMLENLPIRNGQDTSLVDEMKSLINMTIGESEIKNDGETTPTGTLHWSVRQYMLPEKAANSPSGLSAQSKEQYREAAHRLYMQQERHKNKLATQRSSSPPASSSHREQSQGGTQFNTLPKRRSEENVFASVTNETNRTSGRSLPNERVPRSGSWNSHRRIASPVLPSKYVAPSHDQRTKSDAEKSGKKDGGEKTGGKMRNSLQSKSASDLSSSTISTIESPTKTKSPSRSKKKPTPVDSSTPKTEKTSPRLAIPTSINADGDSDREGSITPTNETPPGSPSTPKGQKTFHSLDNLLTATNGQPETHTKFSSAENLSMKPSTLNDRPSVLPVQDNSGEDGVPDLEIMEMEGSPTAVKRRVPSLSDAKEIVRPNSPKDSPKGSPKDSPKGSPKVTWSSLPSPRRRKEKDVFKFLKESDPNYTIRRQQLQMNIIIEKNRHVKKAVENLLGVQLSDDIGEWVTDGVILCQIINKLHPNTIATINEPPSGQKLSRIKQTVNISAFIEACKKLKVPEEHLCSAGDIIEMKDPVRVITCLQRVLETKPGNLI